MYTKSFAKLFGMLNTIKQEAQLDYIEKICKILKNGAINFFQKFGKGVNKCRLCVQVRYKKIDR